MGHSMVVVYTVAGLDDKAQISVCLSSNVVKLIRFLFLFMLCMSYDWYVLMTKDMNTDRMIWNYEALWFIPLNFVFPRFYFVGHEIAECIVFKSTSL